MLTPVSVYAFSVLGMGSSNANDLFESALRELLKGLAGVINIAGYILAFGTIEEEHDHNVICFLEGCLGVNLKLNADKVKLHCKDVPFFG